MDETKLKKYGLRGVIGLAMIGVAALVMPVVYLAAKAVLGMAGIALAFAIALVIFKSWALLNDKIENWLLKQRIQEAQENPIETRIRIANERRTEIQQASSLCAENEAAIKSVGRSVNEYKQAYPDDNVAEWEEAMVEVAELNVLMQQNVVEATQNLAQFEAQTTMLDAKLKVALKVQGITAKVNPNTVKRAYDKLLSETATRAIDERFDTSMASLTQTVNQIRTNKLLNGGASGNSLPLIAGSGKTMAPLALGSQQKMEVRS